MAPPPPLGSYDFDNISYPNFGSYHQLDVVYQDLVYADEFNTDGAVNSSDWFQEVVPPNSWGWHNGEFQHYTNRLDNSYVQDGKLHIVAKRKPTMLLGSHSTTRLRA